MNRAEFSLHARRRQVAGFYLQGKFQSDIAQLLGISQQLVSHDLKALHALWLQEMVGDLDAKKSIELKRLDRIEVAAWEGWERSVLPREMTLTEATEGGEGRRPPTRKTSIRKEGQAGDPRFLQTVQRCVEQRCTLLGLNAPAKIAPTSPDGTHPYEPITVVRPSEHFFQALTGLFQELGPTHLATQSSDVTVGTNGYGSPYSDSRPE